MKSIMEGASYNTKESKLWTRLATLYRKDIVTRYAQLRNNKIFDVDTISNIYKELIIDKISERNYNLDAQQKYVSLPNGPNRLAQGTRYATVRKWLEERLIFCDTLFDYTLYTGSTVQFRANKAGARIALQIKTYSPQYVTVTFSKNDKVTKFCSQEGFTEFVGTAPAGDQNQEMFISSAPFLMEIGGLSGDAQVSSLFFESARRLRKLDVSGSKVLTDLGLTTMSSLQELFCYDCSALATSIDLSSCDNLKVVDAHNTPITGIAFNLNGGSLTTLNLANTQVAQIILAKQPFLREIDLTNCTKLTTLNISECPKLERIVLPNTALESFRVSKCNGLLEINISEGKNLTTIDIYDCQSLETLTISRNYGISSVLNLTGCPNLKTLVAENCSKLKYVAFNNSAKATIETINFSGCVALVGIKTTGIIAGDMTEGDFIGANMDFAGFNASTLNFYNCQSIASVSNLNYVAAGSSSLFYNCKNLKTFINSKLTLRDSILNSFRECNLLTVLPTLDLSQVTNAQQAFEKCTTLTIQQVATILNSCSSKLQYAHRMFAACAFAVTGTSFPSALFNKCTGLISATEMFNGCSNVTSEFPETLLRPLVSMTSMYYMFGGCKFTGKLKLNTFNYIAAENTKLTSVESMFVNNNFTDYDENIFKNLTNLTNASQFFYNNINLCSSTTGNGVKEGLFKYNTKLLYANNFFAGCTGFYGTLWKYSNETFQNEPILLFKNNPELREITSFFSGTKLYGDIPERIFYTNGDTESSLMKISSFFNACRGMTGAIPRQILAKHHNLTHASWLFNGCSSLVHEDEIVEEVRYRYPFPADLLKNKPDLVDISGMFSGCSNLRGDIPQRFLSDCPRVTKVSSLFKSCTGLTGNIPEDLFSYSLMIDDASEVFYNCIAISGTIPPLLFQKCVNVTNMAGIFYNCDSIRGGIPEELFATCRKLQVIDRAFSECQGIGEIGILHKYAIPENLFLNCPDLASAVLVFYRCYALKGNTINDGQKDVVYGIPPYLFYGNPRLQNVNGMFRECSALGGEIPQNLFSSQTDALTDVSAMFAYCGQLNKIYKNMFGSIDSVTGVITTNVPNIRTFAETFISCSSLTGEAPELWKTHKGATPTRCYSGVTKVSNTIDGSWQ